MVGNFANCYLLVQLFPSAFKCNPCILIANMKELLLTGYMSNRGRQNAASYLMYDLNVNWTWGAMWFESRLIDYDTCSNWLNWAYIAGVGNDPRQGRKFIIENQSLTYDPDGKYVDLWLNDQ